MIRVDMPAHFRFPALLLLIAGCTRNAGWYSTDTLVRQHISGCVTVIAYDPDKAMPKLGGGYLAAPDRVVTARHLLGGADRAEVQFSDGKMIAVAGIVAENPTMDLAMIRLEHPAEGATVLTLAPDCPQPGEPLVAVGAPLGLAWTVSVGTASAIRDVPGAGRSLQHSVPVSPGSSGGPLLDMQGRVVAIQTSCIKAGKDPNVQAGQSLNFAVPAEYIAALKPGPLRTLAEARSEIGDGWVPPVTRNLDRASLRYLTRDDFETATAFFEQRTRRWPNEADAWFRLGLCHEKCGRLDEAISAYERAVAIRADHATAWNNLGAIRIRQRKYEEAIEALNRCLKANPNHVEALNSMAVALISLNRHAEAVAPAAEAVRLNPKHAGARFHLGEASIKTGRREEALAQYKALLPLDAKLAERLKGLIDRQKPPATKPTTLPATRRAA